MTDPNERPPRLPVDSSQFDGFIRDLLEVVDDAATSVAPTMATVVGFDGAKPVVHIDGEALSRTVGFSRKVGTRYEVGVRVSMKKTRSGEWIVDGVVTSGTTDRSVGPSQLATDAADARVIGTGVIDWLHLRPDLEATLRSYANPATVPDTGGGWKQNKIDEIWTYIFAMNATLAAHNIRLAAIEKKLRRL